MKSKTEKFRPFTKNLLGLSTWVIARLGGWKGCVYKRKPGCTATLSIGLEKFCALLQIAG